MCIAGIGGSKLHFVMLLTVLDQKQAVLSQPERHLCVFSVDLLLILLRNLGRFPEFLLPELSLLPQFLG
jgi:hypothetical protein